MNYSAVSICNDALRLLSQEDISSLDAKHPVSRKCKDAYTRSLYQTLTNTKWKFATKKKKLDVFVMNNEEDVYKYSYLLPTDMLYEIDIRNKNKFKIEYDVENGYAVCDEEAPLYITYTALIEDPKVFSPEFKEVLVLAIAKDLAPSLVESENVIARVTNEYNAALVNARFRNASRRSSYLRNGRGRTMYNVR